MFSDFNAKEKKWFRWMTCHADQHTGATSVMMNGNLPKARALWLLRDCARLQSNKNVCNIG